MSDSSVYRIRPFFDPSKPKTPDLTTTKMDSLCQRFVMRELSVSCTMQTFLSRSCLEAGSPPRRAASAGRIRGSAGARARRPRILSNDLYEAERHPRVPRARLRLSRTAGRAQAPDAALGADACGAGGRRPARRLHGFNRDASVRARAGALA